MLGPISLAPGASATFTGSYIVPCITNLLTNTVSVVTTNTVGVVTTNNTVTVTTNNPGTVLSNAVASTFGTISPAGSVGTVTDRFVVGADFHGLTYADEDHGYAATKFYSIRHDNGANTNFFDTIAPTGGTGTITDRFTVAQNNFDALAYAAPDVGYGPLLFYYLRHNNAGVSSFGSITPGGVVGVVADHKVLGSNFVALTFSATDLGYGANLFYYIRQDANCDSVFGTIDPAQGGPVTDRFSIGANVDALVFTSTDVGYGSNNLYYLRHNASGVSTFGTIFVTGLTSGNVTDRFPVGTNVTELTFTPTDVLYGPNLFYYLRGTQKADCSQITFTTNTLTSFMTNSVTSFTTNNLTSFTTNIVAAATTNTVTASGKDACQGRTVTATATCSGPGSQPGPFVIGGGGAASPRYSNGNFSLSFATQNGVLYTVQHKTALSNPTWTDLQTLSGTGGIVTILHAVGGQPTCFYRVVISP